MMARGFKPVGWVAGVAGAALSCYMLSLNVASERAELAKLERSIIAAKSDIRSLQTELGTRGRLQQLESWNANVLALSAPTSAQFLDNELTLARFDQREQSIEERSQVHMATVPVVEAPKVEQKVQAPVRYASAPVADKPSRSLVHQAGLVLEEAKPAPAEKPANAVAVPAEKKASAAKADEKKVATVKTASVEKKSETAKKAAAAKPSAEKLAKESGAKAGKSGSADGR